jgi:glycosyltransferase involved in cell wall biosynthesis
VGLATIAVAEINTPINVGRRSAIGVFHPRMGRGGSESFAMWTLEALKSDYRVALIAGGRIDLPDLNTFYGTAIESRECETVELDLPWPLAKVEWGAALRGAFADRSLRRLLDRFDVLISAYNVADFGRPAIHHLADFSWDETIRRRFDPLPSGFRRVIHTNQLLRRGYLALSKMIAGHRTQDDFANAGLILANSTWSQGLLRERYGTESEVVYPPVMMQVKGVPPERKIRRFVCLGRIYPEKRIEWIVEIIKAVRDRGHEVSLHIVGDTGETGYGRKIEQRCRAEGNWIVLEGRQFGEAKARLLEESAYGIHARAGEAFGIAIAEMIVAGCLPFVRAEGGPAEIVGNTAALLYHTPDEAVEKIDSMLKDASLEAATRAFIKQRAQKFSVESFMRDIRRVVGEFVASHGQVIRRETAGANY